MSRRCVTHHHACDCREKKFRRIESERDALRKRVLELEWVLCEAYTALSHVQMYGSDTVVDEALKRVEQWREEEKDELSKA